MLFEAKIGLNHFVTDFERQYFARILSNIVSDDPNFKPYKTRDRDGSFWTLDLNDNWRVCFFDESPNRFAVTYRYQDKENHPEESLAEWLKYRLHVVPIPE